MKTEKYDVTGMTCAACQANVTKCVQKLPGVTDVSVSLLANQMTVSYDDAKVDPDAIVQAVEKIGYGAAPVDSSETGKKEDTFRSQWESRKEKGLQESKNMKHRLIWSICLLIPLMYVAMGHMMGLPVPWFFMGPEFALISALTQLLLTIPVLVLNRQFFIKGFRSLLHKAPNMDTLVAIGSGASFFYGLVSIYGMAYAMGVGDMAVVMEYSHALYFESAAMILTLVTVGKYLEAKSKSKTSAALEKLMDLAPKTACVIRQGNEIVIPANQVVAGDVIVIRPGDGIPVDGVVIEGSGYVDQAAITGESIPVEKKPGDSVISATINKNGSFQFRASRVGEETTLSQIIRLVDEAGNTKAPIARLADKVSGIFVPVVMGIAVITALVWIFSGFTLDFALSNAIAVLVISCPCALGLATPVAIMVGTGKAAEMGILIKSAESLENLHNVSTIVLDKTGTITAGEPHVTDVWLHEGVDKRQFLALAAGAEQGSEHPLAGAVVAYVKEQGIVLPETESFYAEAGKGIKAVISGQNILAGSLRFFKDEGVLGEEDLAESMAEKYASQGKTPLLFAIEGKLAGIIAVADTIKPTSKEAIERFRKMGLQVVMLTGDNAVTAQAIGNELGITNTISGVLPTEKESHVRKLQEEGKKVVMVGDGINDAPALTRADIGVAIGAGTDIAIESADVVLLKDSLLDVAEAIELSKAVVRNIRMNLFWAFFYNILGIPVAAGVLYPAFGLRLSPMIGSAAMSLSSVCVVTNALRLRFFKTKASKTSNEQLQTVVKEDIQKENTIERKEEQTMTKTMYVDGMMCAHCKMHVEKALLGVAGVTAAEVNLEKKSASITTNENVSDEVIMNAVKEAGYTPISME